MAFNLEAAMTELESELDEAKQTQRWEPAAGVYDCVLNKVLIFESEHEGEQFPCYKPCFKILDSPLDAENDTFSRFFSLAPTKRRKFSILEVVALARALNNGEELSISESVAKLVAAGDDGSMVVNVHVTDEPDYRSTPDDANPRVFKRYEYSAVLETATA